MSAATNSTNPAADITAKLRFPLALILFAILLLPTPLTAQVNRQELSDLSPVEFLNYEGPFVRIETRAQIHNIGTGLGQSVRAGSSQPGDLRRYFVINSVSAPDGNKLDADIFGLGVDAAVDHIRNLRSIIQGYLETAYNYSASDAALLAHYVTLYNAVHRGEWNFFQNRYKTPVLGHLSRERAGLSLRYDEWPGLTLMLIPLGSGLGGPLSAIDTIEVSDERVIEQMRQEPDMGLDERRDMVDLMERQSDEAAQQAETIREAIVEEEARIAEERQETQRELDRIAEERLEPGADQTALNRQEQAAVERQEDLAQQEQALDEQRELADRTEEHADRLADAAQDQRQQIAEDQQTVLDREPLQVATPGVLGSTILTQGTSTGRIVRLDAGSGRAVRQSPLTSIHLRTVTMLNDNIVAIAGEEGVNTAIRLVEINPTTLEMTRQGTDDIAPGSMLWVEGQNLYAITSSGGNFYMARFNTELVLQARSRVPVNAHAAALFSDNYLVTQRANGQALLLNPVNLTE
jgi:hypothetical protein